MSRLAHLQPAGDADLFADAPPEVERLAVAVVSRIAAVAQDLECLREGRGVIRIHTLSKKVWNVRLAVAVVSRIAAVAQDLERLRAGGGRQN